MKASPMALMRRIERFKSRVPTPMAIGFSILSIYQSISTNWWKWHVSHIYILETNKEMEIPSRIHDSLAHPTLLQLAMVDLFKLSCRNNDAKKNTSWAGQLLQRELLSWQKPLRKMQDVPANAKTICKRHFRWELTCLVQKPCFFYLSTPYISCRGLV